MKMFKIKHCITDNLKEDAPLFAQMCYKAGVRMNIVNHVEEYIPRGNEILIYVTVKLGYLQRESNKPKYVYTDISNLQIIDSMWDRKLSKGGVNITEEGDIIILTREGRPFGSYYTKNNVFAFTDITHYKRSEPSMFYSPSFYKQVIKVIKSIAGEKCKLGIKKKKEKVSITLGADPEFILKDKSGDVIIAKGVYDSLSSQIGRDGAGTQLELRPSPSSDPKHLINEVRMLFKTVTDDGYNVTLSQQSPLGGHIHVGGLRISDDLLSLLDFFLLPLIVLNSRKRIISSYFGLSKYEEKEWGFEYRTPPAEMWWHPKLAEATLKIVKTVCERYANSCVKIRGFNSMTKFRNYIMENMDNPFTYKIVSNLIALVGKRVTKNFLHYIKIFDRSLEDNFLSFWKIKFPKINSTSNVKFSEDKFTPYIMDLIIRLLSKSNRKYYVFGLKKERGLIWTSNIKPTDTKYWVEPDTISTSVRNMATNYDIIIGLPYELRSIEAKTTSQAIRQLLKEVSNIPKIIG